MKTVRFRPSQLLMTSSRPSPSRSHQNASSGAFTLPTMNACQGLVIFGPGPGFRQILISAPSSQPVAESGNPSPLKSASLTPSAPRDPPSIRCMAHGPGAIGESGLSSPKAPDRLAVAAIRGRLRRSGDRHSHRRMMYFCCFILASSAQWTLLPVNLF